MTNGRYRRLELQAGEAGLDELSADCRSWSTAAGYDDDAYSIDPSVVRGLEYYTGPVFEVELTFPIEGEDGQPVRFGSVARRRAL